jgi:FlaA1/EpsC-like NDP-sugar epimerase
LAAGVYRGIWRYASISDVLRFASGAILAGILLVVVSLVVSLELSGSIAVLFVIVLFNLLVASRLSFRALRRGLNLLAPFDGRALVVGAGELAESAVRYIGAVHGGRLKLVGFVDDDSFKLGKLVHGTPVLGSLDELERVYPDRGPGLLPVEFLEVLV